MDYEQVIYFIDNHFLIGKHWNEYLEILFSNYQLFQHFNKSFKINYNYNGDNIQIYMDEEKIEIHDGRAMYTFLNNDSNPIMELNHNNKFRLLSHMQDRMYSHNLSYKNTNNDTNISIANIYYSSNGNFMLNSIFLNHIYLENYSSEDENYHKLRVFPDNIHIDINGDRNKQMASSIIFTNQFNYDPIIDVYDYVLEVMNYKNNLSGYLLRLHLNFDDYKYQVVSLDNLTYTDVIENSTTYLQNNDEDIEMYDYEHKNLGKRSRKYDIDMTNDQIESNLSKRYKHN